MPELPIQTVLKAMPLTMDQWEAMSEDDRAAYEKDRGRREEVHSLVVFGHDSKTLKGEPVEQGIGSHGRESMNHFTSVRKYEGDDAYWQEVARVWKDHPKHAEKLAKQGLPKPRAKAA